MSIIIAILVFGFLIFVHELGHLLVAKFNDVYVEEFAVGMGPKVISVQKGETKYSLRLLPIGGFCAMAGENEESNNPRGFDKKSVWQRVSVIAAGPIMNFISALVIFVVVFMLIGNPSQSNEIGKAMPDGAAASVGIMSGDKIMAINGEKTESWSEAVGIISKNADQKLEITVLRNDSETIEFSVTPVMNSETGRAVIGIMQSRERVPFFESMKLGIEQTYTMTAAVLISLKMMIMGEIAADVAGPIGIVNIVGSVAPQGIGSILILMAVLSINLGLINLFPFPALDGSRIVFLLIEGIRKKPVNRKIEASIHFIGFALLMILMVVITYSDITKLWG